MSPKKPNTDTDTVQTLDHEEAQKTGSEAGVNLPLVYHPLIEKGVADKLSPKSTGKIYFQLARHQEDGRNYLRIDSNDGGGLHSREWIPLDNVVNALAGQSGHPFKSSILKACMIGKSSNNASFLAAILRSPPIKLIQPSEKSTFLHVLVADFDKRSDELLKRIK